MNYTPLSSFFLWVFALQLVFFLKSSRASVKYLVLALRCSVERVIKIKGELQSMSLQPDKWGVPDILKTDLKMIEVNSEKTEHLPCQAGRCWWIAPMCPWKKTYLCWGTPIKERKVQERLLGVHSEIITEWTLEGDTDSWLHEAKVDPSQHFRHYEGWLGGHWSNSPRPCNGHSLSAGDGLTMKDAEACVDHFSPYIEWRNLTIK